MEFIECIVFSFYRSFLELSTSLSVFDVLYSFRSFVCVCLIWGKTIWKRLNLKFHHSSTELRHYRISCLQFANEKKWPELRVLRMSVVSLVSNKSDEISTIDRIGDVNIQTLKKRECYELVYEWKAMLHKWNGFGRLVKMFVCQKIVYNTKFDCF